MILKINKTKNPVDLFLSGGGKFIFIKYELAISLVLVEVSVHKCFCVKFQVSKSLTA